MSTTQVEADTEPESLLSPELAAELGSDDANLVLTGPKKKKRKGGGDDVSEEVKTLAKQLSKKAQKRMEQIAKRKDREAKQSDFLDVIHEHEISEQQRQLLTSTRDINQTQTLKQLLSSLYKKQAAGVSLSLEEKRVLYNQTEGNDEDGPTEMHHSEQEAPGALSTAVDSTMPLTDSTSVAEVSIDDLFGTSATEVLPRGKNSSKKKTKKGQKPSIEDISIWEPTVKPVVAHITPVQTNREKQASAPVGLNTAAAPAAVPTAVHTVSNSVDKNEPVVAAGKGSVGSGLLAQLQLLKAGKTGTTTKSAGNKPVSVANETSVPQQGGTAKAVYAVEATELPVTSQGEVVKKPAAAASTKPTATDGSADVKDGKSGGSGGAGSARKRAVKVFRSAEVQAARMELPVCGMEQEVRRCVVCLAVRYGCFYIVVGKWRCVLYLSCAFVFTYTIPSLWPPSSLHGHLLRVFDPCLGADSGGDQQR
jgi:hypothetical protein